jgi:hypothetical protein
MILWISDIKLLEVHKVVQMDALILQMMIMRASYNVYKSLVSLPCMLLIARKYLSPIS